jgi:hypothetical protein
MPTRERVTAFDFSPSMSVRRRSSISSTHGHRRACKQSHWADERLLLADFSYIFEYYYLGTIRFDCETAVTSNGDPSHIPRLLLNIFYGAEAGSPQ